jgi:ubiquinone/menaquinone biosynthesis C-methylase UbiE
MSHEHQGCHGGFSLNEATRRSWYSPEEALADLKEGMTFVDVGCGDGYFSMLAAKKVGPNGKVFAVDVDGARVEMLEDKAQKEGLENIIAVVGRAEDTVFFEGCADMVFYSMDLHDFDDPQKVLQNARLMLGPNGEVVDLDWKKTKMDFGPPEQIRFSEAKVEEMLTKAGLKVESTRTVGPYHYLIVAKLI